MSVLIKLISVQSLKELLLPLGTKKTTRRNGKNVFQLMIDLVDYIISDGSESELSNKSLVFIPFCFKIEGFAVLSVNDLVAQKNCSTSIKQSQIKTNYTE